MTKVKSTPKKEIVLTNLPPHVVKDLFSTNQKLIEVEKIAREATQRHIDAHEGWVRFINSVIVMSGHPIDKKYHVKIDINKNEVVLTETP